MNRSRLKIPGFLERQRPGRSVPTWEKPGFFLHVLAGGHGEWAAYGVPVCEAEAHDPVNGHSTLLSSELLYLLSGTIRTATLTKRSAAKRSKADTPAIIFHALTPAAASLPGWGFLRFLALVHACCA